jgi:hypothetical protein
MESRRQSPSAQKVPGESGVLPTVVLRVSLGTLAHGSTGSIGAPTTTAFVSRTPISHCTYSCTPMRSASRTPYVAGAKQNLIPLVRRVLTFLAISVSNFRKPSTGQHRHQRRGQLRGSSRRWRDSCTSIRVSKRRHTSALKR